MNSPNALPWLAVWVLVYVAWRWPIIGGWLLFIMGVVFTMMFDTYENILAFSLISLPVLIVGILFLMGGNRRRSKEKRKIRKK
jgi:uncharacterized membrane protein